MKMAPLYKGAVGLFMSGLLSAFGIWPGSAAAAVCPDLAPGSLFKVPNQSAVYLAAAGGKKMYFPNDAVYRTWYDDFLSVTTVGVECLDERPYPDGLQRGVNYRPGSYLIKSELTASVYAIEPGGKLRKLVNESVASALYGLDWFLKVRTVNDAFFGNYTMGAPIESATPHDGMLMRRPGTDSELYYVAGGQKYMVTGILPVNMWGSVQFVGADVWSAAPTASNLSIDVSKLRANPAGTSHGGI